MADEKNSAAVFAQLRFSLDGKFLLAVVEGRIYVLDAFEGTIERKVTSDIPEGGQALEACLTADGKYVLSGCANRSIKSWSVADGSVVAEWTGHAGVPSCLKVGGGNGWRLFCFLRMFVDTLGPTREPGQQYMEYYRASVVCQN